MYMNYDLTLPPLLEKLADANGYRVPGRDESHVRVRGPMSMRWFVLDGTPTCKAAFHFFLVQQTNFPTCIVPRTRATQTLTVLCLLTRSTNRKHRTVCLQFNLCRKHDLALLLLEYLADARADTECRVETSQSCGSRFVIDVNEVVGACLKASQHLKSAYCAFFVVNQVHRNVWFSPYHNDTLTTQQPLYIC